MKNTIKIIGNYMCKNPPMILFQVQAQSQHSQKYIFNTPADLQRNLINHHVKLYSTQTIFFTQYSHSVLAGLINLILNQYAQVHRKHQKLVKIKFYGEQRHYKYFECAKFHLGQKILGVSYASWYHRGYRIGIKCQKLWREVAHCDTFARYIGTINWQLRNYDKSQINDCRDFLKQNFSYFQDQNFVVRPFFQTPMNYKQPQRAIQKPITNYICVIKKTIKDKIDGQIIEGNGRISKTIVIITYRSLQQIQQIINRQDNMAAQFCSGTPLLNYIQSYTQAISTVIHLIDEPSLIYSSEFYKLYSQFQKFSSQRSPLTHMFYGYGLKSSTTNIHYLINSYNKSIRFYSICSKMFKLLPDITSNHYKYWKQIYDNEFFDLEKLPKTNSSTVQIYKPIHELVISQYNQPNVYEVNKQLIAKNTYPLFSNSMEDNPSEQMLQIVQRRSKSLCYFQLKKNSKIIDPLTKKLKQFDPKVIFLGTQSKFSSDLRNVSGILIQLTQHSGQQLVMLDCGAGTYQQFVNHYPPHLLEDKLLKLKVLFLTHLHADHNLGTLDLIYKRNQLLIRKYGKIQDKDKLFLIMPFNMVQWIHYYCKRVQNVLIGCQILLTQSLTSENINLVDQAFQEAKSSVKNDQIHARKRSIGQLFSNQDCSQKLINDKQFYDKYLKRDGNYQDHMKGLDPQQFKSNQILIEHYTFLQQDAIYKFQNWKIKNKLTTFMPSKVIHCPQSYGIIIQHKNGVKISYSGDCRPTEEFLVAAKQSTLLIHQATYSSQMLARAKLRFHSTFLEAIQAGINSKSKYTCVTHFTPAPFDRDRGQMESRKTYPKQALKYYQQNIIIACDYLNFNMGQLVNASKASKIITNLGYNHFIQKNDRFQPEDNQDIYKKCQ